MSKSLLLQVDRHLLGCAATAVAAATGVGLVATTPTAEAVPVYSGTQNVPIPFTFGGLYINMVNNATGGSAGAVAGWDLNPWVTSGAWRLFPSSNAAGTADDGGVVVTGTNDAAELNFGDPIGPGSTYGTGAGIIPDTGTNFFGIRLLNESTSQIHYGWVRLTLPAGAAGTAVDWGFESDAGVGTTAGAGIPEPSTLGLLALGAVGLLRRRTA